MIAREATTYQPPEAVQRAAQRALDWREEYGRGGTRVGLARGRQLASGEPISREDVIAIRAYLARHRANRAEHYDFQDSEPTTWRIAWDLWGGDPAATWTDGLALDEGPRMETDKTTEAMEDATDYRAADARARCGNCRFRENNTCTQFDFQTKNDMVCDDHAYPDGDDVTEALATAVATLHEAGRKLNKRNVERVRAAIDALTEMLSEMEKDDQEEGYQDKDMEAQRVSIGACSPLIEKANNGRVLVRIIAPGWGASGYYSAEVLRRDGPKVFQAGTQMYLNHPTAMEEKERPERDVRDLAGKLVSDAQWIDDGLYAEAEYYGNHRELIGSIREDLDVSIRAWGKHSDGEAEGRKGRIVDELISVESIDFVTRAGARGKIVRLMESAQPEKVKRGKVKPEELTALQERLARLEELNEAHVSTKNELEAALQDERRARLLTEARAFVGEKLAAANLPPLVHSRLSRELEHRIAYTDDGAAVAYAEFSKRVKEAVTGAWAELAEAAPSGIIRGMGSTGVQGKEPTAEDYINQLESSFIESGMTAERARIAARGGAL